MTTINQTIAKIDAVETAGELRSLLSEHTLSVRATLLKGKIESLDDEIEIHITNEHTDIAIYKLAQMVIFEEELSLVERLLIKQAMTNR